MRQVFWGNVVRKGEKGNWQCKLGILIENDGQIIDMKEVGLCRDLNTRSVRVGRNTIIHISDRFWEASIRID
jgi:hypothetical protein